MRRVSWLLAILVLGVTTAVLAQPGRGEGRGAGPGWGHGPGGPEGFGLCRALKNPDLAVTAEQAARLKPLCKAQREKMGELFESMGELRDGVRVELEKDAPDLDRVGALNQQMATLHTEMARQHVALRAAAKAILSTGQVDKLKALRGERGAMHGKGGAGHRGGGPGDGPCPWMDPDGDGPGPDPDRN